MANREVWIVEYKSRRSHATWHPCAMFYSKRAATTRAAERECTGTQLFRAVKYIPAKDPNGEA